MKDVASIADVIEAFKQKGFDYVGKTDGGWLRLHGRLIPAEVADACPCEVYLDPTFSSLPRIRLLKIPPALPAAVPHLGNDGELCYLAKGSFVLDIYDPVGQSLACLDRAAFIFGKILKGEMVEDLVEEFSAYWDGWLCFADIQTNNLGQQTCIVAAKKGKEFWFVTDDERRTSKKLQAIGYQATNLTVLTYRIRTSAQPRPLARRWPPKTVKDILKWQSILDPRCRRKIQDRIKEGKRRNANGVLIIIESPLLTYGVGVRYSRERPLQKRKTLTRKDGSYGLEVLPVSVVRIDDRYLAQRNMPGLKTLAGKKLVVVGCGTIGGYLSDMLIKAGAGTCGGKVTLIDPDLLLPQNVGRHRLGFSDLLSNKAEALAKELMRLAPSAEIRALPVDVRQAHLGDIDLLIDATGEEALGHWLSGHYPSPVPMLSVWVEGPGIAVRALLRTKASGACYRCLWHSTRRGELLSTTDPLPNILAGHGCEGLYVPFPASVSIHAAALAAEIALDWINGVDTPSLRTRLVDRSYRLATSDCDPTQDPECPICRS